MPSAVLLGTWDFAAQPTREPVSTFELGVRVNGPLIQRSNRPVEGQTEVLLGAAGPSMLLGWLMLEVCSASGDWAPT